MKTKSVILFFAATLVFSISARAATSFQDLYKKNQQAPQAQQKQFFKITGQLLQDIEQKKRKSRVVWQWLFLNESYAEAKSWCVNNGFIAEVEGCNSSNNWSFSIPNHPDFGLLLQAQVSYQCAEGTQGCSMLAGISSDGSGYCSPNSTRQCIAQGEGGGVERLVNVLNQCRQGATEVAVGTRKIICAPLILSIHQQMAALDGSCGVAVREVRSLCETTRSQLQAISSGSMAPAASVAAPTGPANGKSSALFIGDSHSYGCFGEAVQAGLEQQSLQVRSVATCGSSASSWLKASHTTSCGLRSCSLGAGCSKTKTGTAEGLQPLLSQNKPGVTVIALGSNMLKGNWDRTRSDVVAMVNQVRAAGSRCVWVGPPQASTKFISEDRYKYFVSQLRSTVTSNGCEFIDSSSRSDRSTISDSLGIHYNCNNARSWGQSVSGELQRILAPTEATQDPSGSGVEI